MATSAQTPTVHKPHEVDHLIRHILSLVTYTEAEQHSHDNAPSLVSAMCVNRQWLEVGAEFVYEDVTNVVDEKTKQTVDVVDYLESRNASKERIRIYASKVKFIQLREDTTLSTITQDPILAKYPSLTHISARISTNPGLPSRILLKRTPNELAFTRLKIWVAPPATTEFHVRDVIYEKGDPSESDLKVEELSFAPVRLIGCSAGLDEEVYGGANSYYWVRLPSGQKYEHLVKLELGDSVVLQRELIEILGQTPVLQILQCNCELSDGTDGADDTDDQLKTLAGCMPNIRQLDLRDSEYSLQLCLISSLDNLTAPCPHLVDLTIEITSLMEDGDWRKITNGHPVSSGLVPTTYPRLTALRVRIGPELRETLEGGETLAVTLAAITGLECDVRVFPSTEEDLFEAEHGEQEEEWNYHDEADYWHEYGEDEYEGDYDVDDESGGSNAGIFDLLQGPNLGAFAPPPHPANQAGGSTSAVVVDHHGSNLDVDAPPPLSVTEDQNEDDNVDDEHGGSNTNDINDPQGSHSDVVAPPPNPTDNQGPSSVWDYTADESQDTEHPTAEGLTTSAFPGLSYLAGGGSYGGGTYDGAEGWGDLVVVMRGVVQGRVARVREAEKKGEVEVVEEMKPGWTHDGPWEG